MLYSCCDDRRKEAVRKHPTLNGIDYLELSADPALPADAGLRTLYIYCLKPLSGAPALSRENVKIEGGERIRDIAVTGVSSGGDVPANVIVVEVDKTGDYSTYTARLQPGIAGPNFDPLLSSIDFTFKSDELNAFDCQTAPACPPEIQPGPEINYMARDFASFRQLMLDRLTTLLSQWTETSPADLGVMLVELLAYVGDYLSYQQDVIATEAYMGTARRLISLRRHARLLDYHIFEGSNARTWMQIIVNVDSADASSWPALPQKPTRFLTQVDWLAPVVAPGSTDYTQALALNPIVFEPLYALDELYEAHNEMHFYTWGARNCCLPKGATKATLLGHYPHLKKGDVLIFEEVYGPYTGVPEDADLTLRCAVRLTKDPVLTKDPLGQLLLQTGEGAAPPTFESVVIEEEKETSEVIGDDERKMTETVKEVVKDAGRVETVEMTQKSEREHEHEEEEVFETGKRGRVKEKELEDEDITVEREAVRLTDTVEEKGRTASVEVKGQEVERSERDEKVEERKGDVEVERARAQLETGAMQVKESAPVRKAPGHGQPAQTDYSLPITEIEWHIEDALTFPLCISATTAPEHGKQYIENVSVAHGNIVLADHGLSMDSEVFDPAVPEPLPVLFKVPAGGGGDRCTPADTIPVLPRYYPSLKNSPLTFAGPPIERYVSQSASASVNWASMDASAVALPVITLNGVQPDGKQTAWQAQPDLLQCDGTSPAFVVEIESNGTTYLRFGDGRHGMFPEPGTQFTASYRTGNGLAGNVGGDSLVHIVSSAKNIIQVRNPLPARGGREPESVEDLRQKASSAFLTQERAVTTDDFVTLAQREASVKRAAAVQRWTGSWYTTFLAVERAGGVPVDEACKQALAQRMQRYCLAGTDLAIVGPVYVSLEIAMVVQVKDDYFRNVVKARLQDVLSNRILPTGERGYFYADNFTFGQTVYISTLHSAALAVPGVASVAFTVFQRQGIPASQGLSSGELAMDWMEIPRLENDPNFQEHGIFRLDVEGGK